MANVRVSVLTSLPPTMPAIDTMPMPVFAASLRQPARPEAPERKDTQARQAKLQWTEQWRLLRQKAELLMRGALPKAAPSEKELFEVVQPFLEATAALERARSTEASNAWADLKRVKQATARFGELVMHVGAGPDFVAELQEVMEGADARLRPAHCFHVKVPAPDDASELNEALMFTLSQVRRSDGQRSPDEP